MNKTLFFKGGWTPFINEGLRTSFINVGGKEDTIHQGRGLSKGGCCLSSDGAVLQGRGVVLQERELFFKGGRTPLFKGGRMPLINEGRRTLFFKGGTMPFINKGQGCCPLTEGCHSLTREGECHLLRKGRWCSSMICLQCSRCVSEMWNTTQNKNKSFGVEEHCSEWLWKYETEVLWSSQSKWCRVDTIPNIRECVSRNMRI